MSQEPPIVPKGIEAEKISPKDRRRPITPPSNHTKEHTIVIPYHTAHMLARGERE